MFKYNVLPGLNQTITSNEFTSKLSRAEVIAATLDGTYGHDFETQSSIVALGENFLRLMERSDQKNAFGNTNVLPNNPEFPKKEEGCMKYVFANMPFSSLNQENDPKLGYDMFAVRFTWKNHIVGNMTDVERQTRDSNWNIVSPFRSYHPNTKRYVMVDFTSGETAMTSEQISLLKNSVISYNRIDTNTFFPLMLTQFNDELFLETVGSSNKMLEVNSAVGGFDGAGGTGAIPHAIDIEQTTLMNIQDPNQGVSYNLKIETKVDTINSVEDYDKYVKDKWISKNLSSASTGLKRIIQQIQRACKSAASDRTDQQETQVLGVYEILQDRSNEDISAFGLLLGKLANILSIKINMYDASGKVDIPSIDTYLVAIIAGINQQAQEMHTESVGRARRSGNTATALLYKELAEKYFAGDGVFDADPNNLGGNMLFPQSEQTSFESYIQTYVTILIRGGPNTETRDHQIAYLYEVFKLAIEDFKKDYIRLAIDEEDMRNQTSIYMESDDVSLSKVKSTINTTALE